MTAVDLGRKITRGVGWKTLLGGSLAVGAPLIWIVLVDGLNRLVVLPPLGSDPQVVLNAGFAVGLSIGLVATAATAGIYVVVYLLLRKQATR